MTEEWEYAEEETAQQQDKDYLASCPAICRDCRWLDWYYRAGCTQEVYPINNDECYLYTQGKWFKKFWLFKKWDLHYLYWQVRTWAYEKILKKERNVVGSWKQWEYEEYDYDDEECWL